MISIEAETQMALAQLGFPLLSQLFLLVLMLLLAGSAFWIYYYDLKVHKPLEGDSDSEQRISLHNWHNQPKASAIKSASPSNHPLKRQRRKQPQPLGDWTKLWFKLHLKVKYCCILNKKVCVWLS